LFTGRSLGPEEGLGVKAATTDELMLTIGGNIVVMSRDGAMTEGAALDGTPLEPDAICAVDGRFIAVRPVTYPDQGVNGTQRPVDQLFRAMVWRAGGWDALAVPPGGPSSGAMRLGRLGCASDGVLASTLNVMVRQGEVELSEQAAFVLAPGADRELGWTEIPVGALYANTGVEPPSIQPIDGLVGVSVLVWPGEVAEEWLFVWIDDAWVRLDIPPDEAYGTWPRSTDPVVTDAGILLRFVPAEPYEPATVVVSGPPLPEPE
jgi:hypothetical protein